jgi:hypothetical protein
VKDFVRGDSRRAIEVRRALKDSRQFVNKNLLALKDYLEIIPEVSEEIWENEIPISEKLIFSEQKIVARGDIQT